MRLRLLANSRMKVAAGLQDAAHLRQGARGIRHVMEGADHGGSVEQAGDKGQAVGVGGDVDVARAAPQARLGLLELGAGVVEQDDALEALVAGGVAPGAGADLEQQLAAGGQQAAQGDGFHLVFVAAVALIPEGGLVVGAFVVADGGEVGGRFTGIIIRLRAIHRKVAKDAKENIAG